ncbi:diguanylate cyclase [Candidatus Bipolaricaulota bacterium]|nr:diguanylate cyclase [Candidatus Bipolaricaulota bacterium]
MFDLSGLRKVNSRHSHLTGDEVLLKVVGLLKESFQSADLIVRYGGDEFLLVFPDPEEPVDELKNRLADVVNRWNRETDLISVEVGINAAVSTWEHGQGKEVKGLLLEVEKRISSRS